MFHDYSRIIKLFSKSTLKMQERRRQPIEMNRLDIPRIPLLAEKTTADEHENHQTTNIDHPVPAIIPIDQPAIMVRQPVL